MNRLAGPQNEYRYAWQALGLMGLAGQRAGPQAQADIAAHLDDAQLTLAVAGEIPGFGEPIDLLNGGISLARGNYVDAGLSFGSAIPGAGNAIGAARIAKGFAKVAGRSGRKVIVVGENMERIRRYAKSIGGDYYRAWNLIPFDSALAMRRNERWIKSQIRAGHEIVDIGPDFGRRLSRGSRGSPFYNMERGNLKGYGNYRKAFGRNGRYSGGVPGFDY